MPKDRFAPQPCPTCGAPNDYVKHPTCDRPPQAGDVSVCTGCGGLSVWTDDLGRRHPTTVERMMIMRDKGTRAAMAAARAARAKRGTQHLPPQPPSTP